jgi:hypothetical protein
MFRIVIIARGERIKTAGKTVDRRVKAEVVIVGKYDVEVFVELGRGEFMKVSRDESEAYQIAL